MHFVETLMKGFPRVLRHNLSIKEFPDIYNYLLKVLLAHLIFALSLLNVLFSIFMSILFAFIGLISLQRRAWDKIESALILAYAGFSLSGIYIPGFFYLIRDYPPSLSPFGTPLYYPMLLMGKTTTWITLKKPYIFFKNNSNRLMPYII